MVFVGGGDMSQNSRGIDNTVSTALRRPEGKFAGQGLPHPIHSARSNIIK
jgi:hypothetical protein